MNPARLVFVPSVLLTLLSSFGCRGDDIDEPMAQLDDRCGLPEPTQVLALRPDQVVLPQSGTLVAHGDRWLVGINEFERPYDRGPEMNPIVSRRVVSVDACGEGEPRLVAEGIDRVVPPPTDGLPWLGCSLDEAQMFVVDPDGARAPTELGWVRGCNVAQSPGRSWVVRTLAGSTDLVMMEADPDGAGHGSWLVAEGVHDGHDNLAVSDDHVWFVDEQLDLFELEVDAPNDPVVLERGVARVVVANDPRFLAWGAEPEFLVPGPWTVYDRQTDRRIAVDAAGERDVGLRLVRYSLVFQVILGDGVYRFAQVHLPSLETRTVEGRWTGVSDDEAGNLVLRSDDGHVYWLPVGASEPELVIDAPASQAWSDGDEIFAFVDHPGGGQLVRASIDDLRPEVLFEEIGRPLRLDDGRWLDVRPGPDGFRGDLRVLDPMEDSSLLVDRNVGADFARLHGNTAWFVFPGDAAFAYAVHEGGARNGLWSAALAPEN